MSKTAKQYDVIVVGSGAAGGMAAFHLALSGVKVLMLEAGREYDPLTETPMFNLPKDAPLRGTQTPEKPFGFYDATVDGGWQVPYEPYTHAPGTRFKWWRARMLGGRTNHWGRISLRMGSYDFKPRSRDGLGFDWPITYDDIAQYYDKTEQLIGVFGTNEGLENTPDSSPGILQPPPKPRAYELLTKKTCAQLGIPVIPVRKAILTRPLNGRAACFYATSCGRGCSIRANFQSTTVLLPAAVASGNLDIRTGAMVREVEINKDGKASGVIYIDKADGSEKRAKSRVVILGASACESARILLNSRSNRFPQGLANRSGLVGRYLMDTVGSDLVGHIPALENVPPHNEEGVGGMHMYMPWWNYSRQAAGKMDFPRGYHIEFGGGRMMPDQRTFTGFEEVTRGSYGRQMKQDARRYYGSWLYFTGRGEMIPNEHSYCEINPDVKDKWGIPVLKFHFKWSDHELGQVVHMQKTFAEIITEMGGTVLNGGPNLNPVDAISEPGEIIHEVGTTRMGFTAEDSVLNRYCQTWDVPNLFVTDGGFFVSDPDKNPTLTILAMTWRACDYLKDQMKKGDV